MMRITFVSNLRPTRLSSTGRSGSCAGVLAPIERLQRWLLGCRAWHCSVAALTFAYSGGERRAVDDYISDLMRPLLRMLALWIAVGLV